MVTSAIHTMLTHSNLYILGHYRHEMVSKVARVCFSDVQAGFKFFVLEDIIYIPTSLTFTIAGALSQENVESCGGKVSEYYGLCSCSMRALFVRRTGCRSLSAEV